MAEEDASEIVERVADELQAALWTRLERVADELQVTISERLDRAADEFEASIWVRRYGGHVERLRHLSRASEKLVYLFLVHSEPQSFTTMRRSLQLSSSTIDGAVRRLMKLGYVALDETHLYWVSPPREKGNT